MCKETDVLLLGEGPPAIDRRGAIPLVTIPMSGCGGGRKTIACAASDDPSLKDFLAERLGIESELFSQLSVFLQALHDLGKFAENFQNLRPDLFKMLQGREKQQTQGIRHDTLGFRLWMEALQIRLVGNGKSGNKPLTLCSPRPWG